jgi:rubrerythrin
MNKFSILSRQRKQKKQMFQQIISIADKRQIGTCSFCRKPVNDNDLIYYCRSCGAYYHFSCAMDTPAGRVCPICKELTFLDRVVVAQ